MATYTGRWAGGRTRLGRKGETVWLIEGMRREVRYSISLDVQGEPRGVDAKGLFIAPREAQAELALFERDPAAYKAARDQDRQTVVATVVGTLRIDDVTIAEYEQDALHNVDPALRISVKHCADNVRYLWGWSKVLNGQDLKTVTLQQYRAHLRKLSPKRQHIVALRAFTHWLRRDGRLTSAQDASRDLEVPQAGARREAGLVVVRMEHFEKLYVSIRAREYRSRATKTQRHFTPEQRAEALAMQEQGVPVQDILRKYRISGATFYQWKNAEPKPADRVDAQSVRDVLVLRALCGMHHTEVERLAKGVREIRRVEGQGEIAGVAVFLHKKKLPHPQALCAQALAAAERLRKIGSAPSDGQVRKLLDEAADAAGVPRILPTQLRHCFITWSLEAGREVLPKQGGVPRELVRRIVGHTSADTTEIYNGAIPPMIALPLKLQNPEDPAWEEGERAAG